MWKRLLLLAFLVPAMLLGPAKPVKADSSTSITITAVGYICGMPGDFTLTYINDFEVGISWVTGEDAENTIVRAAFGRVPENISDGYQVYYGNETSCTDSALSLTGSDVIYYRAWCQRDDGVWSSLFASGDTGGFMSVSYLFLGWLALAIFMTWFSSRRPEILVRLSAGLIWLGMGFWILLGGIDNIEVGDSWIQILIWVCFVMCVVPFVFQMNTEIRKERKGQSWTEFGVPPDEDKVSGYEEYKKRLHRRTRR